jgi:N-acetylmuramoyl-L-alanine amidase
MDESACPSVGKGSVVVRQGDCVHSVAASHGLGWRAVWEHPDNAELRRIRGKPGLLLPGDLITLPERRVRSLQAQANQANRFRGRAPEVRLALTLLDSGQPRSGRPFVLAVDGRTLRGTTDDHGKIDVRVPAAARGATLTVDEADGTKDVIELRFGALDPLAATTGVQARLHNLGYDVGEIDGAVGPRTRAALRSFQRQRGLAVTGEIDDQTRDELRSRHGS